METTFSCDENNVEKLGQIEEFMEDEYEIEQKKIMKLKREIKIIEARAHTREELYFQWFGKDIAISKCNVLQTKKEKENNKSNLRECPLTVSLRGVGISSFPVAGGYGGYGGYGAPVRRRLFFEQSLCRCLFVGFWGPPGADAVLLGDGKMTHSAV